MPGLRPRSPGGGTPEATTQVSLLLFLPPFPSLENKLIKSLKIFFKKKKKELRPYIACSLTTMEFNNEMKIKSKMTAHLEKNKNLKTNDILLSAREQVPELRKHLKLNDRDIQHMQNYEMRLKFA